MSLIAELLQDNQCCYLLLAYGGWHVFGDRILQIAYSSPLVSAILAHF